MCDAERREMTTVEDAPVVEVRPYPSPSCTTCGPRWWVSKGRMVGVRIDPMSTTSVVGLNISRDMTSAALL